MTETTTETTMERITRLAVENKSKTLGTTAPVPSAAPSKLVEEDTVINIATLPAAASDETKAETFAPIEEVVQQEVAKEPEKLYHVYHCTIKSCRMITEIGRVISFVDGMYVTDQQPEIDYLEKQLAAGHTKLSVVAGKELMTSDELDPMEVLRKKHIAEYLAEQKKLAEGKSVVDSVSVVQKLNPGSTGDVADLAVGSGQ